MRSVVVLPQPEGPMKARNSPSWISKFMRFTASNCAEALHDIVEHDEGRRHQA